MERFLLLRAIDLPLGAAPDCHGEPADRHRPPRLRPAQSPGHVPERGPEDVPGPAEPDPADVVRTLFHVAVDPAQMAAMTGNATVPAATPPPAPCEGRQRRQPQRSGSGAPRWAATPPAPAAAAASTSAAAARRLSRIPECHGVTHSMTLSASFAAKDGSSIITLEVTQITGNRDTPLSSSLI